MTTDIFCPYCPAVRFPNRTRLNEHAEQCRLAELAARPRDPLAVLREALVWADDDGWFDDLSADIRAMLAPAKLAPGKSTPGYSACLLGEFDGLSVRVTISADGATMQVMLARKPRLFHRTRLHLPAQFAMPVEHTPALRNSRSLAERLAEAAAKGIEAEASGERGE